MAVQLRHERQMQMMQIWAAFNQTEANHAMQWQAITTIGNRTNDLFVMTSNIAANVDKLDDSGKNKVDEALTKLLVEISASNRELVKAVEKST